MVVLPASLSVCHVHGCHGGQNKALEALEFLELELERIVSPHVGIFLNKCFLILLPSLKIASK